MDKKLIYLAGPMTTGKIVHTMREAVFAGDAILQAGHAAILPQLTTLWGFISPHSWEEWMGMDEIVIGHCDAVLRMPGWSRGAEREVKLARKLQMPVFTVIDALLEWLEIGDKLEYIKRS